MSNGGRRIRGVHVTEHVILRYLERHYGLDVPALLEEMVSPANAERIKQLQTLRIGIQGDLWLTVDHGLVVTVEPSDARHKPRGDLRAMLDQREEERPRRRANGDASPNPPS